MTQDGSAQVAQAGHRHGSPPEPHVAVSGSVMRGLWLVLQLYDGQERFVHCNFDKTCKLEKATSH